MASLFSSLLSGAKASGEEAGKEAAEAAKEAKNKELLDQIKKEKTERKLRDKNLGKIGAAVGDPLSSIAAKVGEKIGKHPGALGKFGRTLVKFAPVAAIGAIGGAIISKGMDQIAKTWVEKAKAQGQSAGFALMFRHQGGTREMIRQAQKAKQDFFIPGMSFFSSAQERQAAESMKRQTSFRVKKRKMGELLGLDVQGTLAMFQAEQGGRTLSEREKNRVIDSMMQGKFEVDEIYVQREFEKKLRFNPWLSAKVWANSSIERSIKNEIRETRRLKQLDAFKALAEGREEVSSKLREREQEVNPVGALERRENQRNVDVVFKSHLMRQKLSSLD